MNQSKRKKPTLTNFIKLCVYTFKLYFNEEFRNAVLALRECIGALFELIKEFFV